MELSKSVQDKIDDHKQTWTTKKKYGYNEYVPTPMPEELVELDITIESLRDILYNYESNFQKLAKEKAIEYLEIDPNKKWRLEFDFQWGCPGELGYCVYDLQSDYGDDDCLICHQPQERK